VPTPRKSLAEHALQGTKPNYASKVLESHIVGGRPKCPRFLAPVAKKKFRSLMRELEARRVLSPGDGSLLTLAATLWGRWLTAQQHVDEEGAVVSVTRFTKTGTEYQQDTKNKWLEIAQATEKQLAAILVSLGLSVNHRDKAKPTTAAAEKNHAPEIQSGAGLLAFISKRDN
jgi:P27 family predicted phage terminase small subunit